MVSVYGAHLHLQATEDERRPTASAATPNSTPFEDSLIFLTSVSQTPDPQNPGPDTIGLEQEKAELRAVARLARQSAAGSATDAGRRVAEHIVESVPIGAGVPVSGYWPIKAELDVRPILEILARKGHPIGLPVISARGEPLVFRRWEPGDVLTEAGFGTRVPDEDKADVIPQVLLVPLLSFDRDGYRLGYGGGFYDRTLGSLRGRRETLAVGVAFSAQEIRSVPRDAFDQRLDWIVTESETIRIS